MGKNDKNKLIEKELSEEEKEAGYDKSYKYGNATIYMVSPETRLGRQMTEEELKMVTYEIEEAAANMYSSIYGGKYKATLIKEGE